MFNRLPRKTFAPQVLNLFTYWNMVAKQGKAFLSRSQLALVTNDRGHVTKD